ncbi:major facilitator superfamily domain-containing protein [Fennellomyces sp. T-0311]|nr:major facilitator superfamily domain-containing protein [Fennellomyces sp. T-0311]
MQEYYERKLAGDSENVTIKLSVVGTLVTAMIYLFFWPISIIYDRVGPRVLLYLGTLMISGGLVAAGAATKIWQLYLSVSVCSGIGISILFNVCLQIIPFWFDKRRNTVFGILEAGIPFGGLILPFIMTPTNNSLGAPWTFRILGIAFFAVNIIACFFIRERPTSVERRKTKRRMKFDYRIFLETKIILWMIIGLIEIGALYITFTFLPSYATYIGLSEAEGSAVISVLCATSFFGRIFIGLLADHIGPLNTLIFSSSISALSCLLVWMFSYHIGALMLFAVIFGFFSGGYSVVSAPATIFLVGIDRYPTVMSAAVTTYSLGCVGSTVASAIESVSSVEPYLTYKLMTGGGFIAGTFLMIILRFRLERRFFTVI